MIGEFFIINIKIKNEVAHILKNKTDKILDLGCGNNPDYHKSIMGDLICFDIAKNGTTNIVGDADKLPFKSNSFDKIISVNSFYYFKNPFNVTEYIGIILKKGGKLVLVLPFFYPIHDAPLDKYRFTEYGLRTLLEESFKVEKIKTIGGIFNLPAIVLHSLIKGLPLLVPKSIRNFVQLLAYLLYPHSNREMK